MQIVLDPRPAHSEAAPAANRPGAEPVVRPDGRRERPCRSSLFNASSCIEALDRGNRTSVLPPALAASAVLVRQPQSAMSPVLFNATSPSLQTNPLASLLPLAGEVPRLLPGADSEAPHRPHRTARAAMATVRHATASSRTS